MNSTDYFMSIAKAVAQKSKDPSTKVGTVIVDPSNRVVSTGYNGFVAGCDESVLSYERPEKYLYVIHSEVNAILQAKINLDGCKMFTTFSPCVNCLKHILQSGVRHIYYEDSSIMRRTSFAENKAISNLIKSTGATVMSTVTRLRYEEEIAQFISEGTENV